MKIAQYKCSLSASEGKSTLEQSMAIETLETFAPGIAYDYDIIIWNNLEPFTAEHARSMPNLQLLINWGTDDNNLDMALMDQHGIAVKKVDYYATETLAEYIISLLLLYERDHVRLLHAERVIGREIYRKKVGFIGLGKIGFLAATMLRDAYKCDIAYYSRANKGLPGFTFLPLAELFAVCDYIIITVKSANFTVDITQYATKPGLVILNISRDTVLPLADVMPAIRAGKLRGFIGDLDPKAYQGTVPHSVLLVPHRGYLTHESIALKQLILRFYLRRATTPPDQSYLYIARHGETTAEADGLLVGAGESGLSRRGRAYAHTLARQMADKDIRYIYTSPLKQARQTAAIISRAIHVPVVVVPAYAEVSQGIFEQHARHAIEHEFAHFFTRQQTNDHFAMLVPYPLGESSYDAYLRVIGPFLEMLAQSPPFLIIGHEHVNRILRGIAREYSLLQTMRLPHYPDAVVRIDQATGAETTQALDPY